MDESMLIQGLACAALQPGLRRVLVFDSAPLAFRQTVKLWAQMLAVTTGRVMDPVYLGPTDTEETLWGGLRLTRLEKESEELTLAWESGLLGSKGDQSWQIVAIPDLTRLSLAAARACITLMDSGVAHVERHGYQGQWRSHICWIAGCERSQVKFLSPHLLDRFALRLAGEDIRSGSRVDDLREWLIDLDEPKSVETVLSDEWRDRLNQAMAQKCAVAESAYQRVLAYFTEASGQGIRREFSLLRLAQAQAQLLAEGEVTEAHIDQAAKLIGLPLPSALPPKETSPSERRMPEPSAADDDLSADEEELEENESLSPVKRPVPVYEPDGETEFPSAPVELEKSPQEPYPEDSAPVEREAASLRLPPRRAKKSMVGHSTIMGVEPATVPVDLAWVSTLLEAAKYQELRSSLGGASPSPDDDSRLVIRSSDLRRYRRAAVPEQMLMMVLDYTCLEECQWQETLLPYLQWAYVERANVCLVQVGAATAGNELQAQKVTAKSVLVPRIRDGLECEAGRATPLAHGLDLALQTLRHRLRHGRGTVQQAVMVVISDGRGNVPLAASQRREIPTQPVMRQGIDEALVVAEQISRLKQVETVVLNPQPKYYENLPIQLAQALGANIAEIPPFHEWEVDTL
ncbi:MAG: hypothetical protein AAF171_02325 [Cyanobacteria bacterium P01_A01_bin.116]